ncbi:MULTISPECIES: hypothetical protein [Flavobacteriaceae]|uniref:hypothetical protein n=1 Tax=Flavobacteriaceae TaxID=49546 RepID=UPI001492C4CE|nr:MULTISPECIES: hypothetical protein [Allomuricauda]MDC6366829.1 hypothetical protein [Muricauda sp. AC10]
MHFHWLTQKINLDIDYQTSLHIDMAFLKRENIIDGRVKFQRRKTGKRYDIIITNQIEPIIDYYLGNPNPSGFLLPIIYRGTLELQYKDAQWELRRYNIGLKEIAKKMWD